MSQQFTATEHTPTGASDKGQAGERVHSVLSARPNPQREPVTDPPFLADLNLGQMVETIIAGLEAYNLSGFFYEPLHDPAQVHYRHQVLHDLDREEIAAAVSTFVTAMREMREWLSVCAKVRDVRQRQRWFLAAAEAYCDAVEQLAVDLGNVLPQSSGLRGLRAFAVAYGRSRAFVELKAEAQQLIDDLGHLRYTVRSKGLQITVDRFSEETDLTDEVRATFARFRENPAKSYRAQFLEHADNNQVESRILGLIAKSTSTSPTWTTSSRSKPPASRSACPRSRLRASRSSPAAPVTWCSHVSSSRTASR
jgi:DNA mismatch repair protein MutS